MLLSIARRAVPNLVVSVAAPAVCFLVGRAVWGLAGAIALAVSWNVAAQVVRRLSGKPGSGLLIVGMIGLVLRGAVALAMNSARMYFVAPAIVTAVMGVVYAGSAFSSAPLVTRMVTELVPSSVLDVADPRWARLLKTGSLFYGIEQVVVAGLSLLMLTQVSVTTYVAVHPVASWAVLAAGVLVMLPLVWSDLVQATGRRTAASLAALVADSTAARAMMPIEA